MGTVEPGGKGEKPSGEHGFPTPLIERVEGTQKSLLGHLLGAAAISAKPEIDQRALPAAHDALEGFEVPGKNAINIGLVFRSAHTYASMVRPMRLAAGCIIFRWQGPKKMQPEASSACRTR
jgi:hypothetical protein